MSTKNCEVCCAFPESLVIIEAMPLCRVGSFEGSLVTPAVLSGFEFRWRGGSCPFLSTKSISPDCPEKADSIECGFMSKAPRGLPSHCMAVMSCADALALMEEVGHVHF